MRGGGSVKTSRSLLRKFGLNVGFPSQCILLHVHVCSLHLKVSVYSPAAQN